MRNSVLLLFILCSITLNCQKVEQQLTKRDMVKKLFHDYGIPRDLIDGDLDTANMDDIELHELESKLRNFAPIVIEMAPHNRFYRKVTEMDYIYRTTTNLDSA